MKKILTFLMLFSFVFGVRVYAAPQSDGVMAESFGQFFRKFAVHSQERFPGFDAFVNMELHSFNRRLNDEARYAMRVGLGDSFFAQVGADVDFIGMVIDTTYSMFAEYARNTGYMIIHGDHNRMFVASNQDEDIFVHLMLDELGSAFFGYHEAMAAFFAERGRGIEFSQHSPNVREIICAENFMRVLVGGGSLAYDSNFERVLENALGERGYEVWNAAAVSHDDMRDLWDGTPEVADLISFDDLQMVRGLSLAMGRGHRHRPGLLALFEEKAQVSYEEFASQFARYWFTATGELHPEFEIRGGTAVHERHREFAAGRFRAWTEFITAFAEWQNIEPDTLVSGAIMESYQRRFQ